jgi:uncharacterized membrane protein
MEAILAAVLVFLVFSVAGNILQFVYLRRSKKKPKPTLTAEDLLHDLTSRGRAILKVDVIDPANLLLRSPKH